MTTSVQEIGRMATEAELHQTPDELSTLLGTVDAERSKGISYKLFPLFVTFVMYMVSMATSTAAGFDITYIFICRFFGTDESKCFRDPFVGGVVAHYTSILAFIRGIMALLVNTYVGSLSDRVGRKPVLIIAMLASSLSRLLTWYIAFHMNSPSTYWWLALPTLLDISGGSGPVVIMMAISYISDHIEDSARRAKMLAIQDGLLYVSLASGPVLGSLILKHFALDNLFVLTASIGFLAALITSLCLTESLSEFYRQRNSEAKYSLSKVVKPLFFSHIDDSISRRNTLLLLVCTLVGTEFTMSFSVVLQLYPKRKFGWSAIETGYLLSLMASTGTFCLLVGFPIAYSLLSRIWSVNQKGVDVVDTSLFRISLILSASGYLFFGKANSGSQFYMAGALEASAALGRPLYKSCLLKYVPQGQAGSFLAAFGLLTSISDMFIPSMLASILSWSFPWRPSLTFEVVATAFAVVFSLTLFIRPEKME